MQQSAQTPGDSPGSARRVGGSRKGKPNKHTAEVKDMIRQALEESGGVAYLKEQARENPAAFMSLIGKILPKDIKTTVTGANGGPIDFRQIIIEGVTARG